MNSFNFSYQLGDKTFILFVHVFAAIECVCDIITVLTFLDSANQSLNQHTRILTRAVRVEQAIECVSFTCVPCRYSSESSSISVPPTIMVANVANTHLKDIMRDSQAKV